MYRGTQRAAAIIGGVLLLASGSAAAFAESPAETALKTLVANIDASPDWSATYKSLAYNQATDTATLSGLAIAAEGGPVKTDVNTITVAGYAPAADGGFAAKELTVEGLTLDAGPVKIAVDDVALDNLSIPAIPTVTYDRAHPFTSMMRIYSSALKLKLGSGRIGSLAVIEQIAGITSRVSYEHFKIDGMENGKIASVRAGPLKMESPSPEGLVTMTVGSVESSNIDYGAFLHVYNPDEYANGVGDMVWHTALGVGAYHDIAMQVPGAEVAIRGITIEDFKLRQPQQNFTELFDTMIAGMGTAGNPPEGPSDEMKAMMLRTVSSMVSAFGVGRVGLDGLSVKATGIDTFTLDGIHVADLSSDGLGEFSLDGLNGAVEGQGAIKIGRLAFGGLTFPSLASLMAMSGRGPSEDTDPLAFLPKLGFAELTGVDVATPDVDHFKLEKFRLDLGKYIGPIPTAVSAEVDGFNMPVALMKEPSRQTLTRLGYDRIAADYRVKYGWDEAKSLLSIDDLYFGIRNMGSIAASARIGGLTRDAIDHPTDPAGIGNLSLIDARIAFTDASIVGKGLGLLAERMKVPPEKFREQFAAALPFLISISPINDPTILAIIKQSGLLAKIGPAVKTFVAGPGTLTISLAPPTPVGIGQIAEAASNAPQTLPDLLNLTLTATPSTTPQAPAPAPAPTDAPLRPTTPAN